MSSNLFEDRFNTFLAELIDKQGKEEEARRSLAEQRSAVIAARQAIYRNWIKEAGLPEESIKFLEVEDNAPVAFEVRLPNEIELSFYGVAQLRREKDEYSFSGADISVQCSACPSKHLLFEDFVAVLAWEAAKEAQRLQSLVVLPSKLALRRDRFAYMLVAEDGICDLCLLTGQEAGEDSACTSSRWVGPITWGRLEFIMNALDFDLFDWADGDLELAIREISARLTKRPLAAFQEGINE